MRGGTRSAEAVIGGGMGSDWEFPESNTCNGTLSFCTSSTAFAICVVEWMTQRFRVGTIPQSPTGNPVPFCR